LNSALQTFKCVTQQPEPGVALLTQHPPDDASFVVVVDNEGATLLAIATTAAILLQEVAILLRVEVVLKGSIVVGLPLTVSSIPLFTGGLIA